MLGYQSSLAIVLVTALLSDAVPVLFYNQNYIDREIFPDPDDIIDFFPPELVQGPKTYPDFLDGEEEVLLASKREPGPTGNGSLKLQQAIASGTSKATDGASGVEVGNEAGAEAEDHAADSSSFFPRITDSDPTPLLAMSFADESQHIPVETEGLDQEEENYTALAGTPPGDDSTPARTLSEDNSTPARISLESVPATGFHFDHKPETVIDIGTSTSGGPSLPDNSWIRETGVTAVTTEATPPTTDATPATTEITTAAAIRDIATTATEATEVVIPVDLNPQPGTEILPELDPNPPTNVPMQEDPRMVPEQPSQQNLVLTQDIPLGSSPILTLEVPLESNPFLPPEELLQQTQEPLVLDGTQVPLEVNPEPLVPFEEGPVAETEHVAPLDVEMASTIQYHWN
nr:uncharacterized protein LOC128699589 [Cherax quadricarinatus]